MISNGIDIENKKLLLVAVNNSFNDINDDDSGFLGVTGKGGITLPQVLCCLDEERNSLMHCLVKSNDIEFTKHFIDTMRDHEGFTFGMNKNEYNLSEES